ncbi:uncharacterized protein J8A68_000450 [[Candida] subhashii]|uniref:FAD/NAD(P)-binding domain-containing protein n=1 Tax=[Candida] subhashii TaxID=561895 RepID=A0A8J5V1X5_9ASCO|nr:uncharacterized protein J8A68_000450 [[Candida] subhashii]KAG7666020.1 hypothetical protein J8A68_000450 [[Candida] subhashii]
MSSSNWGNSSYIKNYEQLSKPSQLPQFSPSPISFTTNILVVGGAYAGLATISALKTHLSQRLASVEKPKKISITLVEPRNGLLNILGIPKAIVDTEFAKTQFVPFNQLKDFKFTNILSKEKFQDDFFMQDNPYLQFNYVHGLVTYLDSEKAQYLLNNDQEGERGIIEFDYVIMATGRDRNWPTTPRASTFDLFVEEMSKSKNDIATTKTISVIGAGAVGLEIAGDIKSAFPEKEVNLIHPHSMFPAEPLSEEFKTLVQQSIEKSGVNVYLNTRIAREADNGDLITTTNKTIPSELNFWCTTKHNNTDILSNDFKTTYVSKLNNIHVNEYLQMAITAGSSPTSKIDNFFVIGDLVELPIIKSAGWAMYMGRLVANNLQSLLFDNKLIETFLDLKDIPFGMVVVAGNEEIVSELAGDVQLNHPGYVEEYKDYCIGKVRATLNL